MRNPASLLDNAPLRELLTQNVRFDGIRRSIEQGPPRRASRSPASGVCDGALRDVLPRAARAAPRGRACGASAGATRLTVDHLMASAAVPFVFPPVQIGGEFYGDGSMRHRAPLSPAIHLGADRMLVVGVRDERPDAEPPVGVQAASRRRSRTRAATCSTRCLWTACIRISSGCRGPTGSSSSSGTASCPVTLADLRPLAHARHRAAARTCARSRREFVHELPRGVRLLLRGLGASSRSGMQLVSYLLFESGFTRALIDMGYRDAMEMEDELRAFIFDQPMATLYAPAHLKLELDR